VSAHQYDGEVPNQAARPGIDILVPFSFALYTEPVKVARFLQATLDGVGDEWRPSWNIPPTRRILAASQHVDEEEVTRTLELGFLPR
jgi:hypothetical protein